MIIFYQCIQIKFQGFDEQSLSIHKSTLQTSFKPKTELNWERSGQHEKNNVQQRRATPPPTAQVCSGAEKPPRWGSPLPVTRFYRSSDMALGAGSDSEVS